MTMKYITLKKNQRLCIETPLGIVNIRAGLTDSIGREIESISVQPDRCCGEKKIVRRGAYNIRLVQLKTQVKRGDK